MCYKGLLMYKVTLFAMAAILPACRAYAQAFESAQQWFDATWRAAGEAPAISGFEFVWTTETLGLPDAESIISKRTFRGAWPSLWRLDEDRLYAEPTTPPFVDWVMTPDYAFKLLPHWLVVVSATGEMPAGHPIRAMGDSAFNELACFEFGAMQIIASVQDDAPTIQIDGRGWQCQLDTAHGPATAAGYFDPNLARGFPTRLVVGSGKSILARWEIGGWRCSQGRWRATELDYFENDVLRKRLRLQSVALLSDGKLSAVTQLPEQHLGEDRVRGRLNLRSFTDFRQSPPLHRLRGSDGKTVDVLPWNLHVLQAEARFRQLGWIVGAFTIAVLVTLRASLVAAKRRKLTP